MSETAREPTPLPKSEIRRFDVFAEYNRQKSEQSGMPPDQAKGYGLWLAKVVAARKFAKTPEKRAEATHRLGTAREQLRSGVKYLDLSGQPQTAELFDRQIIGRMGDRFYHQVLSPAIAEAIAEHHSYEKIRDAIRKPWNEARQQAAS